LGTNQRRAAGHWAPVASANAEAKRMARMTALSDWSGKPLNEPLWVLYRFVFVRKGGKLPDTDNLSGYAKPLQDGLNGIVWVDDDLIERVAYERVRADKTVAGYYPNGCVVILIDCPGSALLSEVLG